jgi:hypothetical protein
MLPLLPLFEKSPEDRDEHCYSEDAAHSKIPDLFSDTITGKEN